MLLSSRLIPNHIAVNCCDHKLDNLIFLPFRLREIVLLLVLLLSSTKSVILQYLVRIMACVMVKVHL